MSRENEGILRKSITDGRKWGETPKTIEVLVNNTEENIYINMEKNEKSEQRIYLSWQEIEMHWESSRKIPGLSIIVETLDCGRKFKEERDVVET